MRPLTLILTAFGPFPGAPANPTPALARALCRRRRPGLPALRVHVFATVYAAVDAELPALVDTSDALFMLGLSGRRRFVAIEKRAVNRIHPRIPDAARQHPRRRAIDAGPQALATPIALARLKAAARGRGAPARLSRDAGSYLCNYAYRRALGVADGRPVLFVHVPQPARLDRPKGKRKAPTLAAILTTLEAVLVAFAAGVPPRHTRPRHGA